jgi:hypothetical protein
MNQDQIDKLCCEVYKGREAIRDLLIDSDSPHGDYYMLDQEELAGVIINILRSLGWVHRDDVVEGKELSWECIGDPDSADCRQGCDENCSSYNSRPATVGDLIGGLYG